MCVTFIPAGSEICEHVANVPGTLETRHRVPSKLHQSYARAMRIDKSAWRTAAYSHKYLLHVKIICKYRRVSFSRARTCALYTYIDVRDVKNRFTIVWRANWDRTSKVATIAVSRCIYRNSKLHEIETGLRQCSDGNVADYKYEEFGAMKNVSWNAEVILYLLSPRFIFVQIYLYSFINCNFRK